MIFTKIRNKNYNALEVLKLELKQLQKEGFYHRAIIISKKLLLGTLKRKTKLWAKRKKNRHSRAESAESGK